MGSDVVPRPSRQLDEFEERVYRYFEYISSRDNAQTWGLNPSSIHFESASRGPPAQVTYRLTVEPSMTNLLGNLHGGCAATLIDNLSTTILWGVSSPGLFESGGVSRNLNLTYLRPVPVGADIRIICEVVQLGKRLALLRSEIRLNDSQGTVCVISDHQKFNTDARSAGKF
ncbi:hypothetical protein VTN49DRAFT_4155 [Thermomyces lanuginosus]|uniref:uncharacterized protein n=1 Tax=Thermomyces lanuginosus TaxID=5541 RepID=UPI0037420394